MKERSIHHLDFMPEPSDSRILSAIDPNAGEHDQHFRAKVTGWDKVSRPNQSAHSSRSKPRNFPSAVLLLVVVIVIAGNVFCGRR